jgi:integrase
MVGKAKLKRTDAEIFQPEEMEKLLLAAPEIIIGYLAIGAFAGLRGAELSRLEWSAVDLERRSIHLRADQAKTASRRIVPMSENLVAWLSLVTDREGLVMTQKALGRKATVLARKIGLSWPNNVLRHSYISYRLATIQDANQVALEAGNSAAIIFKHYRELVTEEAAGEWFTIMPPEGWEVPEEERKRRPKGGQ